VSDFFSLKNKPKAKSQNFFIFSFSKLVLGVSSSFANTRVRHTNIHTLEKRAKERTPLLTTTISKKKG